MRLPCQSTGTLLFSSNKNLLFTSLKSQSSLINFLICNYFIFRGRCSSHLTRLDFQFCYLLSFCISVYTLSYVVMEYLGEVNEHRMCVTEVQELYGWM